MEPIKDVSDYRRDVYTRAVINTNDAGYNAYMRQREILTKNKEKADSQEKTISVLQIEMLELKRMLQLLLNKDSNGVTS